jgi:hypothetical protein
MNFLTFQGYTFRYFLCHNTQEKTMQICLFLYEAHLEEAQTSFNALDKQRILFELYEALGDLFEPQKAYFGFQPIFTKEDEAYQDSFLEFNVVIHKGDRMQIANFLRENLNSWKPDQSWSKSA